MVLTTWNPNSNNTSAHAKYTVQLHLEIISAAVFAMGASQSKIPSEEKVVIGTDDEEYVHVENELTGEKGTTTSIDIAKSRKPEGLSFSTVSKWESTLLDDPKNR